MKPCHQLFCKAVPALAAILVIILATASSAQAQGIFSPRPAAPARPIPTLQPPPGSFDYPQHQTLTYSVDWRVFTGGTAVFHLDQSNGVLKITANADTIGSVNLIFPVVDRFQSGLDLKTGCSTGFSKQIQEGRRKIASDLSFDYEHGKQAQNERNLVKGTVTHKEANIPRSASPTIRPLRHLLYAVPAAHHRPDTLPSRWRTPCAPLPSV